MSGDPSDIRMSELSVEEKSPEGAEVPVSIQGNYVRTLVLRDDGGNRGLAISPDGSRMVVSNQNTHKIAVYSLPDGAFLAEFGDGRSSEPGKFNAPQKVCFSPRNSGNILISDLGNKCVKEITLAGEPVRAIGGEIEGQVIGLAASVDLIAVCTYFGQVHLFDVVSGDLVRSFSERGDAEGQLFGCLGFRFTPDGSKLLIAEYNNKRLSLFSLTGELVRCIGAGGALKGPRDVDFAPNGDILVADADARNQHICVFSSDGSTLLRSFGVRGDGPGQFQAPGALAITRGELYVVDEDSTRVQVFN